MKQIQLKKIVEDSSKKIKLIKDSKFFFEDPFNHFYINNFFDELFADNLLESFLLLDLNSWNRCQDQIQKFRLQPLILTYEKRKDGQIKKEIRQENLIKII